MRARRFTVPSVLIVTVLGCAEEDGDDETGASTQSMTSEPMGSTGVDPSETSDDLPPPPPPDCSVGTDEDGCGAVDGCRWIFNLGCVLECNRIDTQELCEMQLDCAWEGDACDLPGSMEAI